MVVLGSRKQECINPSAWKAASVDETCNELQVGGECEYFGTHRKLLADESIALGGKNEIWDIEDIVGLGKSANACPYYASQQLAKTAVLVFCPYYYIVDPIVRSAAKISLDGNIVILDEAHNIEGATRDAVSVEIVDFQLARLVCECEDVLEVTVLQPTYTRAMEMAKDILAWLHDKFNVYEFQEATMNSNIWPTPEASLTSALEHLGFTEVSVQQLELDYNLFEEESKTPQTGQ
ncbi:hypothetical protein GGI23_002778 [Coemansia sp. RSA 2559]|nr:hypothetical protein GGI23_002778 [Coemansia sp. RSA 2559]KAJ2864582.1 hypothetical protein GGI22_001686 [Coemansia erecta]